MALSFGQKGFPTVPAPAGDSTERPAQASILAALVDYFRSGWALLIPYLATYLIYAWLRWPVNPVDGGLWTVVPCMLHVYWVLHAVHLVVGAFALRAWWQAGSKRQGAKSEEQLVQPAFSLTSSESGGLPAAGRLLSTGYRLLPWLCLALLFYIPGIYLEWPSDPWEHLRRINEWRILDQVTTHSSWMKSSYFLPYSLTEHTTGLTQLNWLNFYYTAICLLLSWQYYRLARAVGLCERAAFVFVLLNALTFGNNIFSFYRYYGLSSSILAQIGAVALTRLALEFAQTPQLSLRAFFRPQFTSYRLSLIAAVPALLALTAFNHIQGLAIAGLGVLAVVVWRLIERKPRVAVVIALAVVMTSIAVALWFPRHSAIDDVYRARGWLNAWYGFNFHSPSSPALDRALQIVGFVGLLNFVASLWLVIRQNHLAGWLTLMPVLTLSLPCFAVPFSHILTVYGSSPDIILTFHRLLFAVSGSPALVVLFASALTPAAATCTNRASRWTGVGLCTRAACLLVLALVSFTALSPGKSTYNRLWQGLQVTPGDLSLRHFVGAWDQQNLSLNSADNALIVTSPLGTQVRDTLAGTSRLVPLRQFLPPPAFLAQEFQLAFRSAAYAATLGQKRVEPSTPPDRTILSDIGPGRSETRLVANLTGSPTPWIRLGGQPPQQAFTRGALLVGNPPGQASDAFSPELIRVDHHKRYRVSAGLRQAGNPNAVSYLAVAWYGQNAELLRSNSPAPEGAGEPLGWVNGNYSYFGLVGRPTTENWTTYETLFGRGERAAIPEHAVFLRVGALLNHDSAPGAGIQLSEVRLAEIPGYARAHVVLPDVGRLLSPSSTSAQLSGHWSAHRVVLDHAGMSELRGQLLDSGR